MNTDRAFLWKAGCGLAIVAILLAAIGVQTMRVSGQQDANFTVNGASQLGSDVDVGGLIAICLSENDKRLAPYDARLKRPRFVPFMARLALKVLGKKKAA